MEFQGPQKGEEEPWIQFYLLLLLSGAHFSPSIPLPDSSLWNKNLILSLHSFNHFQGSLGTVVIQHQKCFGIPLESLFPAQLLLLAPSVSSPTSHFLHPHSLWTISSFLTPLLSGLCAHSFLYLEFPFLPGASSNSIQHISQVRIETNGAPGSVLLAGDTVEKVAGYSPSLTHLAMGRWEKKKKESSQQGTWT